MMQVILIVLAPFASPGARGNDVDAGTAEYAAGLAARADSIRARVHFQRAAEAFESAWQRGPRSSALARNMAQARLLAGDTGRAIRDYRRGLRVAPHDRNLLEGLRFGRSQVAESNVGAAPAFSPSWHGWRWSTLVWLTLALAAAGWIILAWAWLGQRRSRAVLAGLTLLLAAGAGGLLWQYDRKQHTYWHDPTVVVVAPGADLRSGNNSEFPRRVDRLLPPGTELHFIGERGGWYQVELADGTPGWVAGHSVVIVD